MHLKVKNKIAYTTEIAQTSLTEIQNLRWGGGWKDDIFFKSRDLFQTAAKGPSGIICYDSIGRGSFKLQMSMKLPRSCYRRSANV